MQLQGLALLCTTIYYITQQQLNLFHAICVIHLSSPLSFGLVARPSYEQSGRVADRKAL